MRRSLSGTARRTLFVVLCALAVSGCGNPFCVGCTEPGEELPPAEATDVVHFRAFDPLSGRDYRAGCFALRVGKYGFREERPVLLPVTLGKEFAIDWFEAPREPGPAQRASDAALCAQPFSPEIDWNALRPECLDSASGVLSSATWIDASGNEGPSPAPAGPGGVRFAVFAREAGVVRLSYTNYDCQETLDWPGFTLFSIGAAE